MSHLKRQSMAKHFCAPTGSDVIDQKTGAFFTFYYIFIADYTFYSVTNDNTDLSNVKIYIYFKVIAQITLQCS